MTGAGAEGNHGARCKQGKNRDVQSLAYKQTLTSPTSLPIDPGDTTTTAAACHDGGDGDELTNDYKFNCPSAQGEGEGSRGRRRGEGLGGWQLRLWI